MDPFLHFFLAVFFSIIPMLLYLIVIWLMDRYEREPFWMVLLNFGWGASGAIIFGIIGSLAMGVGVTEFIYAFANESDARSLNNLAGAVVVAPFVEEITMGIFLLIFSFSKQFDGPVDGAVFGGAIGLGFGMTENFIYFQNRVDTMDGLVYLIIIRTLFTAVMHCSTQAVFGAAIGYAKFRGIGAKIFFIPAGLGMAMFMHFMWNFSVSFESTVLLGFLFMIFTIIIIFVVFQFAVHHDHKIIKKELTDELNLGHLPADHLLHLPYPGKRHKKGWLPVHVNQRNYIRITIRLAMRKHQSRILTGPRLNKHIIEIDELRNKMIIILIDKSVV